MGVLGFQRFYPLGQLLHRRHQRGDELVVAQGLLAHGIIRIALSQFDLRQDDCLRMTSISPFVPRNSRKDPLSCVLSLD